MCFLIKKIHSHMGFNLLKVFICSKAFGKNLDWSYDMLILRQHCQFILMGLGEPIRKD